ncbi:hypothetical protein RJT34_24398 [Clitoria ternatea]|uniref:Senescence regulator n=1 Tax=Clitoria ternatea TaxID=43366 RepID=A0AAN9FPL3_CLITE
MASRKSFLAKPSYIFPKTSETHLSPTQDGTTLELEEAELLWNSSAITITTTEVNNNTKKAIPSGSHRSVVLKRGSRKVDGGEVKVMAPASLPVNIPDWSKILKQDYKEHQKWETDDEDEDEDEDDQDEGGRHHHLGGIKVPPHEYLARTRGASLSVHEGIGRTLKGRDLRSVRNAIWKKVGFEG